MSRGEAAAISKLCLPRCTAVIERQRLIDRIAGAGPVVWIAAPPGAGKTTLVASFAGRGQRAVLWYRIDGGDTDPAAFFYFMGQAAAAATKRRAALPLLTPEYLADLPGFARRYFRTLYESLPTDSLLVFDNYHEIDAAPAFHAIMREALDEVPVGFKVLVASRTAPPSSLARLAANGQLDRLGWDDLRLTPEETLALAGDGCSAEAAWHIHEQSGGWMAGAILLQRHGAGPAPALRSRQTVFDYFIGEIFARMPAPLRELLVATAFFPDFTVAMALAAGQPADAAAMLDDLCRQHCFIDASGELETSYRYHDLFREFLRAQAGGDAPARRDAAARTLLACGRAAEAVPLLLENGDGEAAAGAILAQAQSLVGQGRWRTLADWIDALPEDLWRGIPWLTFWRGIAELPARPLRARAMIEQAFAGFAAAGDRTGQLLAATAAIEVNYLEYADFSVLDRWLAELEGLGGARAEFPSVEIEVRALTGMLAALYMRQPANPLGQVLVDRLEILLERGIEPNLEGMAITFMLWFSIWVGDFAQARRLHADAGRLLAEGGLTPLNDIMLRSVKGHGEGFLGDGEGAGAVFDTAEEIAHRHGFASARTGFVLPMQIYRHLMFGDLARAGERIAATEKQPFSGPMNASQVEFSRSWLALLAGNAPRAAEHARLAAGLAERSGSFIAKACTHSAWALALVRMGDLAEARRQLATARSFLEGLEAGIVPFHLLLVEAWLTLRTGDPAACHPALRRAFAQGAAQGYASTMQWLPGMMAELCAEALRAGIEPDYARWLIRKRRLAPPTTDLADWPWPLEIRTLGGFSVLSDGEPLAFSRKAPKKPITLLKAIVAFGGRDVAESRLIDALWPDGEAADEALAINLHRLRKLLGNADAIRVHGGRIGLDPDICRVDAWSFERLADRAAAGEPLDACLHRSQQLLALYRGNFLADDGNAPWTVSMRERLRMKFVRHVATTADRLCRAKECRHVVDACQRGIDTDDLIESFYQQLMRCHLCLGNVAEGLATYRRLKQTLSLILGIAPAAASERLHSELLDR